jgi:hypothetical protein
MFERKKKAKCLNEGGGGFLVAIDARNVLHGHGQMHQLHTGTSVDAFKRTRCGMTPVGCILYAFPKDAVSYKHV